MFSFQKRPRRIGLLIVGLALMGQVHLCWGEPLSSHPPTIEKSQALRTSELEGEASLRVKVSFEAKGQLLSDLLVDLQKQSKLDLVAGDTTLASSLRVTAYIQDLPLSQVLMGLSRLYGVPGAKTAPGTFTMLSGDKGKLETELLRLGDDYTGRFLTSMRNSPEHMDWPQEIVRYVNEQDLRNGGTPQISILPAELLDKIRREKEQIAALRLVEMYEAAMEASVDEYILRAEVPLPPKPTEGEPIPVLSSPRILVRKLDGQVVTWINPGPSLATPKGKTFVPNQPTRNIPGPT